MDVQSRRPVKMRRVVMVRVPSGGKRQAVKTVVFMP